MRRPTKEHTLANKNKAISFAAYRAAVDLLPGDKVKVFDPLMAQLGYDINDTSADTRTPSGIGNVACAAVLAFRHNDGSNQLGTLSASGLPYSDYTGYVPQNKPSAVPVSDLSTQFLDWCCELLQTRGKRNWLLIWDNASWHKSLIEFFNLFGFLPRFYAR